jgi:hypothetical protein
MDEKANVNGLKGEGDLTLSVRIHEVGLHPHLRVVMDKPLDHGGDFGGSRTLKL